MALFDENSIIDTSYIDDLFSNEDVEVEETSEEEIVNTDELFIEKTEDVIEESSKEDELFNEEELSKNTKENNNKEINSNVYNSVAKAFVEDGIFTDISDEDVNNIQTSEDFVEIIEKVINSKLDEKQKRINDALNYDIEPDIIRDYEGVIDNLNNIKEDSIKDESEEGSTLRKQLIYQDFINRGYSKERAEREVNKSFNSGSDIEDALESLNSNKEFFKSQYDTIIKEAKEEKELSIKNKKEEIAKFKSSVLEDKSFFGNYEVDKSTRQKVYDNVTKPIYKDPDTGELLTAIQKYERDNKTDFIKNLGLVYTLTDGFRDFKGLLKGEVKKEVKKGIRDLENIINNTSRTSDGSLNFVSGVDSNSFIGKGWKIQD